MYSYSEYECETRRNLLSFGLRGLELLFHLSFHRNILPLSITSRLLDLHDVPQLIATLITIQPWNYENDGKLYCFKNGHWEDSSHLRIKCSKIESQMWLSLHFLLIEHDNLATYALNSSRVKALTKLNTLLAEIVFEIPELQPLVRYISALSFVSPEQGKGFFPLIVPLPQIGDSPFRKWNNKWEELLKLRYEEVFSPSESAKRFLAQKFSEAFDLEILEALSNESPLCVLCGYLAAYRCSKCQNEWYCRRLV